ncbi:MAG: sulfotransferase family 2 domain-containing protein [Opitutaceae bacterium]
MNQTVIFVHIPKTAGNTLRAVLTRNCGPARFYYREGGDLGRLEAFKRDYATAISRFGVVGGHVYFGFHEVMTNPFRYLTMVREPVSRVVSQYRFIRSGQSGAWLKGRLDEVSLREFVERGLDETTDNCQVRRLAGLYGRYEEQPYGAARKSLLDDAWKNICHHRILVGVQSEFDRSLLLYRRELGWKRLPVYRNKNVTRPVKGIARKPESLATEEIEAIRAKNLLDLELYGRIDEKFGEVRQSISDRDVRRFQFLNRMINSLAFWKK